MKVLISSFLVMMSLNLFAGFHVEGIQRLVCTNNGEFMGVYTAARTDLATAQENTVINLQSAFGYDIGFVYKESLTGGCTFSSNCIHSFKVEEEITMDCVNAYEPIANHYRPRTKTYGCAYDNGDLDFIGEDIQDNTVYFEIEAGGEVDLYKQMAERINGMTELQMGKHSLNGQIEDEESLGFDYKWVLCNPL